MYRCMYVYIYIYIYVYTHTYTHTYTYVYIYIYIYTYIYIYIYTCELWLRIPWKAFVEVPQKAPNVPLPYTGNLCACGRTCVRARFREPPPNVSRVSNRWQRWQLVAKKPNDRDTGDYGHRQWASRHGDIQSRTAMLTELFFAVSLASKSTCACLQLAMHAQSFSNNCKMALLHDY